MQAKLGVVLLIFCMCCSAQTICQLANWSPQFLNELNPSTPCSQFTSKTTCQIQNLCCFNPSNMVCFPSTPFGVDCSLAVSQSACSSTWCTWNGIVCLRKCPFTANPEALCQAIIAVQVTPSPLSPLTAIPSFTPSPFPETLRPTNKIVYTRFPMPDTTQVPTFEVVQPTFLPSRIPSSDTKTPSVLPTKTPSSRLPTSIPTKTPSRQPSLVVTSAPSLPSRIPTSMPTSVRPSSLRPTLRPSSQPTGYPTQLPTRLPISPELLCSDTCPFAFDTECDDGGEGSRTSFCDLGSDCSDCGGRSSSSPITTIGPSLLTTAPTLYPTTLYPTRTPTFSPTDTEPPTSISPTSYYPTKAPSTRFPTKAPTILTPSPTFSPKEDTVSPTTWYPTSVPSLPLKETTVSPTSGAPIKAPTTSQPTGYPSFKQTRAPTPSVKTNFVIMLADDMGWGDTSVNGGFKTTQNLMDMSQSGHSIVFENFHSGGAMCSPSRVAMLSGQYPDRNCVSGAHTGLYFQAQNNTPTFALDAKEFGYSTFFTGKWHLSGVTNNFIGERGFDTWTASYGNILTFDPSCMCQEVACKSTCSSSSCARAQINKDLYCLDPNNQCEMGSMNLREFQTTGFPPYFECDMKTKRSSTLPTQAVNLPRNRMACDFLVDEFEAYLRKLKPTQHFLAVINFHESHRPFVADPAKRRECEMGSLTCTNPVQTMAFNSVFANYFSVLESLDAAVGRVRRLIREFNRESNTLVIFSSDNGPENEKQGGGGSPGPLRGWKRTLFEGGHRVPGIIEWPQGISGNFRLVHSLVSILDLRPTMREIMQRENANVKLTEEPILDGLSLIPLFESPLTWTRSKTLLICRQVDYLDVIRGANTRLCDEYAFYKDNFKIIVKRDSELKAPLLFDLDKDRSETNDLSSVQRNIFLSMVEEGKQVVQSVFSKYQSMCGGYVAPIALDEADNTGGEY